MLLPSIIPAPRRIRRQRRAAAAPAGPAALTLISAYYDETIPRLTLEFSRAINIASFFGGAVIVNDGQFNGMQYNGQGGISLIGPDIVEIELLDIDAASGGDVRLDAGAANGIVAADDGAAWAGASGLVLPFG